MGDVSSPVALPSTLHHLDLHVVHADAGLEARVAIKVARHPSETVERLWLRVLAYAWRWEEGIAFGPGLCAPDAPDVLVRGHDGELRVVVRVGKPDPARVERDVTANRGARVAALLESPRRLEAFVAEARARKLARLRDVSLAAPDAELLGALAGWDDRRLRVGFTFVADHVYADVAGTSLDGPLHRAVV
jgi:uncharacterized protein YaeQ